MCLFDCIQELVAEHLSEKGYLLLAEIDAFLAALVDVLE